MIGTRMQPPTVYPVLFAQLMLRGESHVLRWKVQKPFRASEILLFGSTDRTWVHSFKVGFNEQIAEPFPFLAVMRSPSFSIGGLLKLLEKQPDLDERIVAGARMKKALLALNNMTMRTAAPGHWLTLHVTGPLSDAAVYGVDVD